MGPCKTVGWRCVWVDSALRSGRSGRSVRSGLGRVSHRGLPRWPETEGSRCAALPVTFLVLLLLAGCEPAHDCGALIPSSISPVAPGSLRAINQPVLEHLDEARRSEPEPSAPSPEHWLALIPGTSEEWGHHRAPPPEVEARGQRVSSEFAERLDLGYRLLTAGAAHLLLISGGAVDAARPDYIEAERGRDYLLRRYAASWSGERPLAEHLLVDPLAQTTPENVRNADKLAIELGLSRLLILTTTYIGLSFGHHARRS